MRACPDRAGVSLVTSSSSIAIDGSSVTTLYARDFGPVSTVYNENLYRPLLTKKVSADIFGLDGRVIRSKVPGNADGQATGLRIMQSQGQESLHFPALLQSESPF